MSNTKIDWKSTNVLVTGAGGFIGSHLTEELLNKGANVTALVNYNSRNDLGMLKYLSQKKIENLEILIGDIRDKYFVNTLTKNKEYVFHLAALIGIPYSYIAPNSYIETNIKGSANIFQGCLENNVKKVIHTSTSEVYGSAIYTPIDESHPLQGQSPYSASKIGADMTATSYASSFGLPISILRPFNTYGPRQSSRAVIPTIISQAIKKRKVELGSLTPLRDLNYVKDTVNGFICLAESDFYQGEIFNLASTKQISIGDLADLIKRRLEIDFEIISSNKRKRPEKSEVDSLLGSAELLKLKTNWKPEFSLEEGIDLTINYIRNNIENFDNEGYVV